jgi:5-methylcytosine-specific restriction protein A
MKLARDPFCEVCWGKGKMTEAVEVDHITPLEQGGEPFDDDNLQSICKRCHGAKTGAENSERMKAKNKQL